MNCLLHSYRLELWDERPRAKLVLFIKDRIELPQRVPLPSLVQAYYKCNELNRSPHDKFHHLVISYGECHDLITSVWELDESEIRRDCK